MSHYKIKSVAAETLVPLLEELDASMFITPLGWFHREIRSPCTRRPRNAHVSCSPNKQTNKQTTGQSDDATEQKLTTEFWIC